MTLNERLELFQKSPLGEFVSDEFLDYLLEKGFFDAPASTKYHGAYEGGLFDHSYAVMNALVEMSVRNGLRWTRAESPFIVGMFHDLCKIDQYRRTDDGKCEYNPDTLLKGHGDKSIILLSQFITLTEEEIMCIRYHMGAFVDKDEWRDYTNAVNKYSNVLWTHHADMIASHVVGV